MSRVLHPGPGFLSSAMYRIMTKKLVIRESENTKAEGRGIFCFTNDDVSRLLSVLNARLLSHKQ